MAMYKMVEIKLGIIMFLSKRKQKILKEVMAIFMM